MCSDLFMSHRVIVYITTYTTKEVGTYIVLFYGKQSLMKMGQVKPQNAHVSLLI